MAKLLYIHGMGGGADSRIPSILSEELSLHGIDVTVRTYDFNPEVGARQISDWVEELHPSLVIGESLGALQALRISGVPKIFVSPALNTPIYFTVLAWLTFIPGVGRLFGKIYKPREGDRQPLNFTHKILGKYKNHRNAALATQHGASEIFAFFGTHDHYRRSGVVSVRTWRKYFGDTFSIYDGTHFMEDEYVRSLLVDKVLYFLDISK